MNLSSAWKRLCLCHLIRGFTHVTRTCLFLYGGQTRFLGSNFLALIILGKLLSSLSDINCIRRIKHLLSFKILKNVYFAMILPYIDYCSTSWGPSRQDPKTPKQIC